jgi:hypothetical protein
VGRSLLISRRCCGIIDSLTFLCTYLPWIEENHGPVSVSAIAIHIPDATSLFKSGVQDVFPVAGAIQQPSKSMPMFSPQRLQAMPALSRRSPPDWPSLLYPLQHFSQRVPTARLDVTVNDAFCILSGGIPYQRQSRR